ncbi:D-alanyl-D-alanine carboxypeptidase, partial [Streptomyces sp. BF-3]
MTILLSAKESTMFRRRSTRLLGLALVLALLSSGTAAAGRPADRGVAAAESRPDSALRALAEKVVAAPDRDVVAFLLAHDGARVRSAAAGVADRSTGT